MRLSSVDLPEPEGPISAANSPPDSARLIPCSTSTSTSVPTPYDFLTPASSISGSVIGHILIACAGSSVAARRAGATAASKPNTTAPTVELT